MGTGVGRSPAGRPDVLAGDGALTAEAGIDPSTATTPEALVSLLGRLRRQSGLSYREIARRARARGHVLPVSTLAGMLARPTLPRRELVSSLLDACGVPADRQSPWLEQWRVLTMSQGHDQRHDRGRDHGRVAADPDGPGATVIPRQLPAAPGLFAGRDCELARLTQMLDERGAVVISTVTGTGGVGKTWLAVRWAHDNLDRFPDGQLHLNLRGFDPSDRPTPAGEALRALLGALGVTGQAIPAELDGQIGLYRSLVAGKRMLILLDNARDAEQVRPLLPGTAGSAAIVTSRRKLTSLVVTDGADLLPLDLLTNDEAHRLLEARLGKGRLADEPEATAQIIERCARLPLALAMVAARAVGRPQSTLAELADELRDSEDRFEALTGDAPGADIRAVFSWSYHALTPDAAGLFRLLGLHPGPDIGLLAVASLAGVTARRARQLLAELAGANLVAEQHPGRYSLHDLLHAYAAERAHVDDSEDGRRAGIGRMLDHYLHTAYAACLLLAPMRSPIALDPIAPGVAPEPLAGRAEALGWFNREYRVLAAIVHHCGPGLESHVWRMADVLGGFFTRQGHWYDWHATSTAALLAAQRADAPCAQARAHCWLAELYAWIGRYDDTDAHLDQAEVLYRRLGNAVGLAYVHLSRGWVHEPRQAYAEALHDSEQSLRLYTAAGDAIGQANALNNIGWYQAQLGNYRQALETCQAALARHEQIGNRTWVPRSWEAIGYAHYHLGHYRHALACYRNAINLFRELGNRFYEARALDRLGDLHHNAGRIPAARRAWLRAHRILHQLHHPHAQRVRSKFSPDETAGEVTGRGQP